MLTAFVRAFRTPDLRSKILFSMGIMALFRLGSVMPTPGVSYEAVQDCIDNNADTGLYSLINLFSGGALLLNFPLLALWDRDATVFGLPLLPCALFAIWAVLIGLIAWIVEPDGEGD